MPKTIFELEDKLAIAQERIQQLEKELGLHLHFPLSLKLTRKQEALFGLLMKREIVSQDSFLSIIYNDDLVSNTGVVGVHICHINLKLKPFGIRIHNAFARGYYLTSEDKHAVREIMQKQLSFLPTP